MLTYAFYNLEIFSFVFRQKFKYNSICIKKSEHTEIKNNISPTFFDKYEINQT